MANSTWRFAKSEVLVLTNARPDASALGLIPKLGEEVEGNGVCGLRGEDDLRLGPQPLGAQHTPQARGVKI